MLFRAHFSYILSLPLFSYSLFPFLSLLPLTFLFSLSRFPFLSRRRKCLKAGERKKEWGKRRERGEKWVGLSLSFHHSTSVLGECVFWTLFSRSDSSLLILLFASLQHFPSLSLLLISLSPSHSLLLTHTAGGNVRRLKFFLEFPFNHHDLNSKSVPFHNLLRGTFFSFFCLNFWDREKKSTFFALLKYFLDAETGSGMRVKGIAGERKKVTAREEIARRRGTKVNEIQRERERKKIQRERERVKRMGKNTYR